MCMHTSDQNDGLQYTLLASCMRVSCVCVRSFVRSRGAAGRSVGVRRRRRAFPFRIVKVQRAIPQCAYFYIHSWNSRSTNNSPVRPKKKNARGTHTEERLYRVLFEYVFLLPLFLPPSEETHLLMQTASAKIRTAAFEKSTWRICAIFLSLGEKQIRNPS